MNTLPPLTFEGHLQHLLDWLRLRVSDIDAMPLRFYDQSELVPGNILPAAALKDVESMRLLFERLCREGRGWIHLAGDGMTRQGEYLISVEYSQSTGHSVTYVNLAGPPLNPDGSVKQRTNTHIA